MSSILLRPPPHHSPYPSPSPSPTSTPLPALQTDLSSSSSSASGSYLDLRRASPAPSTRRIRFAPLPDPNRDLLDHGASSEDPQSDTKSATQPVPQNDAFVALSPSVSRDSTLSSVRSTPTVRISPDTPSKNTPKSNWKLLRPLVFLRRTDSSSSNKSSLSQSASLPGSRNPSDSSLTRSSSPVPNSPSIQSPKRRRFSTEDIFSFGRKSLFRARSGSASSTRPLRPSSPPPKSSDSSKFLHRSASTGSGSAIKVDNGKRDWGEGSSHLHDIDAIAGSGAKRRRSSSSALTPGAGGGRHASSAKMLPDDPPIRPSTAPSSPLAPPKKHVKMLNGRVYGGKRYATQTLANPFANVRDEPEFVEWGYGGMGSVHASAGIANDMWKGLQRSERGSALLAGSSFGSPSSSAHPIAGAVTAGGGRGSGARATSPIARRTVEANVPECSMGSVGAGGGTDDDGSGMGWVKKRRAEREAKTRLEQETKELERKTQEKRKSGDSMDASMYASTASTTTSLTACTSTASTDLTTPTTSPPTSRSPSVTDLKLTLSPCLESRDLRAASPCTVTGERPSISVDASIHPPPTPKDDHDHHVLTAVRLSPNMSSSSHRHEQVAPFSPIMEEATTSTISFGEEGSQHLDEEEEQDDDDDDEHEAQDVRRKTALGAGVEKISRHMDAEAR